MFAKYICKTCEVKKQTKSFIFKDLATKTEVYLTLKTQKYKNI